jgi:hypothetical protein
MRSQQSTGRCEEPAVSALRVTAAERGLALTCTEASEVLQAIVAVRRSLAVLLEDVGDDHLDVDSVVASHFDRTR